MENSDWKNRTVLVFRQEVPLPFFLAVLFALMLLVPLRYLLTYGKWQEFTSEQYGYSIEYPAAWPLYPHGDGGYKGNEYLRSRLNDANLFTSSRVLIHENSMEVNASLIEIAEWGKKEIHPMDDYEWSDFEEVTIGAAEYPALKQTYTRGDPSTISTEVYYLKYNEHGFTLEFLIDEENESTRAIFDKMLASFELFEATRQ